MLADPDVTRRELAQLRCQAPGCDKPAHRAGRFCSHACSVRKYAAEMRRCKWEECGKLFEVPGHRAVQPGAGLFCTPACLIAWRWKHKPDTFPQSERCGAEKACRICGKTRYRPPSHLHVEVCSECFGEARRDYEATQEGKRQRANLEAAQGEWRKERQRDIDAQAEARGARLTADVIEQVGPMSVPNLTRYWVGCGLETERVTIGGVTVLLYLGPDQVSQLARLRANGPAWDTWLDPDWRLARARKTGELSKLIETGLSEAAAIHAIRGPIEEARAQLRRSRRGPKPAPLLGAITRSSAPAGEQGQARTTPSCLLVPP